jgi:chromosome partitioning protein
VPQKIVEGLLAESLPVLNTRLSASVKMKESHNEARPLIHLAPAHKLTQEFLQLFAELEGAGASAR